MTEQKTKPLVDPLYQLEQQYKHYQSIAKTHRSDANRSLEEAARADETAMQYKIALEATKKAFENE